MTSTSTLSTVNSSASTTGSRTSIGVTSEVALTTKQKNQITTKEDDIQTTTIATTDHGTKSTLSLDDVITTNMNPTTNFDIEPTTIHMDAGNAGIELTARNDTKITTGFDDSTVSTLTTKNREPEEVRLLNYETPIK